MIAYSIRRILITIPTLFFVATVVFIAMRIAPGDPAVAISGGKTTEEGLQAIRVQLGLDKPIWNQYIDYLKGLFRGDLGKSYKSKRPVTDLLAMNLPYTLHLVFAGTIIGILTGLPIGVLTAVKRNSFLDYFFRVFSLAGVSLPLFYLGLILLLQFALKLPWFPTSGAGTPGDLFSQLYHLILPATAAGLLMAAYVARETRSSMLEVLLADYIRTARSKGLREATVLYKHALRNTLVSIITLVGIYINVLLASSVMLEVVFSRPGLGRMILGAIKQYDYQVLQSTILVFAALISFVNLLVDLSYCIINPNIRLE